jgi:hypothetical protein
MAHQNAEVVAGDMDQVALVDVLAPSESAASHATAVERVSERSLDDLGPFLHCRFPDSGA